MWNLVGRDIEFICLRIETSKEPRMADLIKENSYTGCVLEHSPDKWREQKQNNRTQDIL
jgi:hypothetical protein